MTRTMMAPAYYGSTDGRLHLHQDVEGKEEGKDGGRGYGDIYVVTDRPPFSLPQFGPRSPLDRKGERG